tara:strand:- start:31 stop:603 length:573 start_codon:yes stop_codon:yes gene_type:complete
MVVSAVSKNRSTYYCLDVFSAVMDAGLDLDSAPGLWVQIESSQELSIVLTKGVMPSLLTGEQAGGATEAWSAEVEEKQANDDTAGSASASASASGSGSDGPQSASYRYNVNMAMVSASSNSALSSWYRAEVQLRPELLRGGEGIDQWYFGVSGKSDGLIRVRALFSGEKEDEDAYVSSFTEAVTVVGKPE